MGGQREEKGREGEEGRRRKRRRDDAVIPTASRGGGEALLCCVSWKSLLLEFGTGLRCWWSRPVCSWEEGGANVKVNQSREKRAHLELAVNMYALYV